MATVNVNLGSGAGAAQRVAGIASFRAALAGDDLLSLVVREATAVSGNAGLMALNRQLVTHQATIGLVLLRRWQLDHRQPPRGMAALARDAKLANVPADAYNGKPSRLASATGETLIYSIGKGGRDDGGRVDSKFDT